MTLLEFAETIRLLSISLNDEMIYEINHILISISLMKMSNTFHPQLRICVQHYLVDMIYHTVVMSMVHAF